MPKSWGPQLYRVRRMNLCRWTQTVVWRFNRLHYQPWGIRRNQMGSRPLEAVNSRNWAQTGLVRDTVVAGSGIEARALSSRIVKARRVLVRRMRRLPLLVPVPRPGSRRSGGGLRILCRAAVLMNRPPTSLFRKRKTHAGKFLQLRILINFCMSLVDLCLCGMREGERENFQKKG